MTIRTYTLTVRDVPKSVNAHGGGAGTHHMQAHKEKKRWEAVYLMELMAARVPRRMTACIIDVTIRWKHPNHRDVENYRHPVVKPLQDSMVRGGYIADDTADIVRIRSFQFEHPETWHYADPRIKADMTITLEATY